MGTLHVRNVPDDLHQRIRSLAEVRRRSVTAEVIALLDRAVSEAERQRTRLETLDSIYKHRFRPPRGMPEAQELIREDRNRRTSY